MLGYLSFITHIHTYGWPVITRQETKIFTEVGMANESTKSTHSSVQMAQHNE